MKQALKCAEVAYEKNEVPIGAVVVQNGKIIGSGYNTREMDNDITGHAEIHALKQASTFLNTWKLDDCQMYVTVKPCLMCYSAIEQSRIKTIYYGTDQYAFKKRAFDTLINESSLELIGPILEEDCQKLLKDFFERMRNGNN